MLAMPTGGAPTSAREEETGVVADRSSDDLSTYDVSWNVLVGPEPDGGFGWQIWTEHSLWIPHAASGRASTEAEANAVARAMATRCTEAARMYMQGTGVRDVTFALLNVFPDSPAGGGVAVKRLSEGAVAIDQPDEWDSLEERAVDWQTRGGRQTFVAMDAGEVESGWRLRELFGCMGALGEQVMLACASARDLAAAVAAPESPRDELIRRAWAEHVSHWTMAGGHMLQNVVGRTIALDPAVRPHLVGEQDVSSDRKRGRAIGTVFPKESDANKDWPTFNRTNANHLRRAATRSEVPEVIAVGELIHRVVVDPRWVAMTGLRGEAFHRWRAQTAGVSTMTRRMTRVVGDDGLLPGGQLPDVRGPESSAKAVDFANSALRLLGDALADYDSLLPGVMSALTSSVMHTDGLLSSYGPISLVESARGTGVMMLPLGPERVRDFLTSIAADGRRRQGDET